MRCLPSHFNNKWPDLRKIALPPRLAGPKGAADHEKTGSGRAAAGLRIVGNRPALAGDEVDYLSLNAASNTTLLGAKSRLCR